VPMQKWAFPRPDQGVGPQPPGMSRV